jgi:hypothetical protein
VTPSSSSIRALYRADLQSPISASLSMCGAIAVGLRGQSPMRVQMGSVASKLKARIEALQVFAGRDWRGWMGSAGGRSRPCRSRLPQPLGFELNMRGAFSASQLSRLFELDQKATLEIAL